MNNIDKLRSVMVITGILGAWATLFPTNPSPVTPIDPKPNIPIVIPDVPPVSFPGEPTNQPVKLYAEQVRDKITDKKDALVIARTFRDWGTFLVNDKDLKNTYEFQQMFQNATRVFFQQTGMTGKYSGLDKIISDLIVASLKGADSKLIEGNENAVLNPTIRDRYKKAMDAISWGAYQSYLRGEIK